jgi:hypothetical protein
MSKTIRIEYYGIEGEGPTVKEAKAAERDHHRPLFEVADDAD